MYWNLVKSAIVKLCLDTVRNQYHDTMRNRQITAPLIQFNTLKSFAKESTRERDRVSGFWLRQFYPYVHQILPNMRLVGSKMLQLSNLIPSIKPTVLARKKVFNGGCEMFRLLSCLRGLGGTQALAIWPTREVRGKSAERESKAPFRSLSLRSSLPSFSRALYSLLPHCYGSLLSYCTRAPSFQEWL